MTTPDSTLVFDRDGVRGTAEWPDDRDARYVLLRLEDGQTLMAERTLLREQEDGSYRLPVRFADLLKRAEGGETVVPVIEEVIHVEKRDVEDGRVRIAKTVSERDVLIDQPLMQENVEVTRVTVNQVVEQPPEIRHEGDTMIIPVLEEVVVVEIRLMLREEIHVRRTRGDVHAPQSVTVRREEVVVERLSEDKGVEDA